MQIIIRDEFILVKRGERRLNHEQSIKYEQAVINGRNNSYGGRLSSCRTRRKWSQT